MDDQARRNRATSASTAATERKLSGLQIGVRNRNVERDLDRQHQLDHRHRRQASVIEIGVRGEIGERGLARHDLTDDVDDLVGQSGAVQHSYTLFQKSSKILV